MNNGFQRRQLMSDTIKIKCRGYSIDTCKIPNMSDTITMALIKGDIIYFSCEIPFAIKYKNGKAIMTFRKLGAITMLNKIKLREKNDYVTVLEQKFNAALFELLSKR